MLKKCLKNYQKLCPLVRTYDCALWHRDCPVRCKNSRQVRFNRSHFNYTPELVLQSDSFRAHSALHMAAQAEIARKEIRRSRRPQEIAEATTFSFVLRIDLGRQFYKPAFRGGKSERWPHHAQNTYSVALVVVHFGLAHIILRLSYLKNKMAETLCSWLFGRSITQSLYLLYVNNNHHLFTLILDVWNSNAFRPSKPLQNSFQ